MANVYFIHCALTGFVKIGFSNGASLFYRGIQ